VEGRYAAYAYRGSRVRIHAEVMRTITAYHYFYSDRMRSWSQNKKARRGIWVSEAWHRIVTATPASGHRREAYRHIVVEDLESIVIGKRIRQLQNRGTIKCPWRGAREL
jgi:hypothetical protein